LFKVLLVSWKKRWV